MIKFISQLSNEDIIRFANRLTGRTDRPKIEKELHRIALYYTDYSGNIMVNAGFVPEKITVIYRVRPALKYADEESYINLPVEFVDMLAARLRAEAYKLANDDAQGAKWMMDYNTQLETLKVWASMRNVRYGE